MYTTGYPMLLPEGSWRESGMENIPQPWRHGHVRQGKTMIKGGSPRKVTASVSSEQFPRHSGIADLPPDPV